MRFIKLRDNLGLRVGYHHIRALFATTFASMASVEQAMAQLGHRDVATTMRYVNSTTADRLAVAMKLAGTY